MGRKEAIINVATDLFVAQGFDATPTLQIAKEAGVTEPLVFYHFKNKDGLFTEILRSVFDDYAARMAALPRKTATQAEKIEALMDLHLTLVADLPKETYLIVSACPARLRDPEHVCSSIIQKQRELLKSYLTACIQEGMASGEFREVPLEATVYLIFAYMTGLIRQQSLNPFGKGQAGKKKHAAVIQAAAVDFLQRSLLKG